MVDKVSCPGLRKHSKKTRDGIQQSECCNRTLLFVDPEDKISKIVVICHSCGRVYDIRQSEEDGVVLQELDKQQRIQYEQSLKVVLDVSREQHED